MGGGERRRNKKHAIQSFLLFFTEFYREKKREKNIFCFSLCVFVVVCACCRNKVLQIETRERSGGEEGREKKARLVSLFHFLCWNSGSEHLKTKRISNLGLLAAPRALRAAPVRESVGSQRPLAAAGHHCIRTAAALSWDGGSAGRAASIRKTLFFPLNPRQSGSDFGSVGLSCSVCARIESCSELFNISTNRFVLLVVSPLLPKAARKFSTLSFSGVNKLKQGESSPNTPTSVILHSTILKPVLGVMH